MALLPKNVINAQKGIDFALSTLESTVSRGLRSVTIEAPSTQFCSEVETRILEKYPNAVVEGTVNRLAVTL